MHYDKHTLTQLDSTLDSFLSKTKGLNKPYEGLLSTGIPAQLQDNIRGGILRQVAVVADRFKHTNIIQDNMEPLSLDQEIALKSFLQSHWPALDKFVSRDAIYVKLKTFFEWGVGAQYQRWGQGGVAINPTNQVVLKSSMSFYRGEESGLAGLFGNEGTNLLGNAFYVAPNETQARMFGDIVTKYDFKLDAKSIFHIRTDDELTKVINSAIKAFPGEDTQTSIPKYLMGKGYKAAMIDPAVEPRGGVAIFDQKLVDSAKIERLTAAGAESSEAGFINIGGSNFSVTNPEYIARLQSSSDYLLNKSNLDETTRNRIIDIISQGKQDGLTNDEVSNLITDEFNDIADWRSDMIARTETAAAMSQGQMAGMQENGVGTKAWIGAGEAKDEICSGNVDDGFIPINEDFSSGDSEPPGHPNCECYLEAGEINLDELADNLWDGE